MNYFTGNKLMYLGELPSGVIVLFVVIGFALGVWLLTRRGS